MGLAFEWDRRKAALNQRKHAVGFEEAITVFDNPLTLIFDDDEHSDEEQREIAIGHSARSRLLLVSFVERRPSVVRVISARLTTKKERQDYEENATI
jgi:uncharacterized DUF497 family protein